MNTLEALLIAVLVLVALSFLLQIELYRNVLALLAYNSPEAAPPLELRFSQSFLKTPAAMQTDAKRR